MKINLTKLLEIPRRVKQLSPEIPLTAIPVEFDYDVTGEKEPYSFELENPYNKSLNSSPQS